ncbi:hypothetical protein C8Q77DRAFT_1133238 [Trametes polyzona]|nr:hypothetical protein C8Q77DRAFT_1133238 [Trametes polyzona]
MRFSSIIYLVLSVGLAAATPAPATIVPAAHGGNNEAVLHTESGCGSVGPLGKGHFKWYIGVFCNPGARLTCQATDASGCVSGATKHIGSMEVDDENDTFQIAKKSKTNTLELICPSEGAIRCQANFNDNNDGPNYSLRGHRTLERDTRLEMVWMTAL